MYHYDASIALEELKEDALLPHPVRLRAEPRISGLSDAIWRTAKRGAGSSRKDCRRAPQGFVMLCDKIGEQRG
jgi:hypothetical protein